MLISELFAAINSENPYHPVIRMLDGVEIFENYLEPGMVARVVGANHDADDVIVFDLVLTEFDEYNKQFESSHYYDKNLVPCLSARESGNYEESISIYVDLELDTTRVFELVDPKDIETYVDPVKTFQSALSKAQARNRHEFGSFTLETIDRLALHLFTKGDVVSPLAMATRSCLEHSKKQSKKGDH